MMRGPAHLLHARLLAASQQPDAARAAYAQALHLNPGLADTALANELQASARAGWQPAALPPAPARRPYPPLAAGLEKPRITFQDVGGMRGSEGGNSAQKIIHPLHFPDFYTKPTARPPAAGCCCTARPAAAKPGTGPAPRPVRCRPIPRAWASPKSWICGSATARKTCTSCSRLARGAGPVRAVF
ncbi:MAG: hypothetical protein WKG07_10260 [Hymenobacter sp.]